MEWVVRDFNDEWAKDMMDESYHDENDYKNAFESAHRLLSEAENMIKKSDGLDMIALHNGIVDEDQIYDDWCEEMPLFIKRSVKKL